MAKYDPLFEHLRHADGRSIEMSFEDVGARVGGLPKSAYLYVAWWANEIDGRHVQARAWMNADRLVEHIDLNRQVVRFGAARRDRG